MPRIIAGTLSDARAARALLLGHYFGRVSRFLLFSARPRSVCPARRALIFTGGLRSQRQKAITDLASRWGAPIARTRSDYSWLCGGGFVKASVPTPIGRPTRGRGPNASLWAHPRRLCCRAGGRQNAGLSGPSARPMTQTDAYRAGRGLILRLAAPRRRRSRAVLPERTSTKKGARPGAKRCNRDRCCAARAQ